MQNFINLYLEEIQNDFYDEIRLKKASGQKLCDLDYTFQKFHGKKIDYSKKIVQQHYLLVYAYAYILEYHYIYSKIHLDKYKVLSMGCGAFLDLFGLYFAKPSAEISYFGVDSVDWSYRRKIIDKQKFDKESFDGFLQTFANKCPNFNVFTFPKSIDYLSKKQVELFGKWLTQSDKISKEIYLVLNGSSELFDKDVEKLDLIKKALMDKGYVETEMFEKTSDFPEVFVKLPEKISFNLDKTLYKLRSMICGRKKPAGCTGVKCAINKEPMLYTNTFRFKIYRMEKR